MKKEKKDEKPYQPLVEVTTIDLKGTTCESFCLSNSKSLLYVWVLDLGASFHMSPHIDWFVKYQPYSGGMVYYNIW